MTLAEQTGPSSRPWMEVGNKRSLVGYLLDYSVTSIPSTTVSPSFENLTFFYGSSA